MGSLLLGQIKQQASSFLHDKYKTARLAFTDVTEAELLAEEATNNEPRSPDARTMARIAEASFEIDDYWRIVDVLHRRFYSIDWKRWRQSYNSLVLLEFLLTHGPEDFAEEFQRDTGVIEMLGTFNHKDEKGFNWGICMQKKSNGILKLLGGGETFKAARLKALRITKEIQGFGGSTSSTSPSSSTASSSSEASRLSSFFSPCSSASPTWNYENELRKPHELSLLAKDFSGSCYSGEGICDQERTAFKSTDNDNVGGSHLWDCPGIQETGFLLDSHEDEDYEKVGGFMNGICSKLAGTSPSTGNDGKVGFRSASDAGRKMKKKFDRQHSLFGIEKVMSI